MRQTNGNSGTRSVRKRKGDAEYPVHVEAAYTLREGRRIVQKGQVQTIAISRTELVLDPAQPLPAGLDIELTLYWPAPVSASERMAVRIKGRTSRSQANGTTVRIASYDFEVLPEPVSNSTRSAGKIHLSEITPLAS